MGSHGPVASQCVCVSLLPFHSIDVSRSVFTILYRRADMLVQQPLLAITPRAV